MILLTGATGFLGSKILKRLVQENYEVVCIKRSNSKLDRIKEVYDKCFWFDSDKQDIEDIYIRHKIDIVIHCATNYGRKETDYFEVYESNLMFPLRLFRNAQKYGCRYFINTSTFFVKEIKNLEQMQTEVYMNAYVKSKYIFTDIIKEGIKNAGLAFINLQLEHVYGADDGSGKFVEFLIQSLKNNVPYLNLTEGVQTRDWIYVEDVISVYILILHKIQKFRMGHYYHFEVGTGIETSLKVFAEEARRLAGSSTELRFGMIKMNVKELSASHANNHMLRELGWKPSYDISKGIIQMIGEEMDENNYGSDSNI